MNVSRPPHPIKLHGFSLCGHSHRVELLLNLLDLPYEMLPVDLAGGAQKQPAFLSLNRFGQVPVIEDGEVVLVDSNAILVYLATRYGDEHWLPRDAIGAARVQRWLSVAAGPVAFGPAAARRITVFKAQLNAQEVTGLANELFTVMEAELQNAAWLTGDTPSIADLANYAYIAHAPEGNVSLQPYPQVRAWLARIEGLPGFIPMPRTAVGLAA